MTKQIVDKNAEISKNVEETLGNMKTVKQFSKESFESTKYSNFLTDLMSLSYKEIKAKSAFFGMVIFELFRLYDKLFFRRLGSQETSSSYQSYTMEAVS